MADKEPEAVELITPIPPQTSKSAPILPQTSKKFVSSNKKGMK